MRRRPVQGGYPMLPGMGRPEFGGVQLRPGFELRRAGEGDGQGLFAQGVEGLQARMFAACEREGGCRGCRDCDIMISEDER